MNPQKSIEIEEDEDGVHHQDRWKPYSYVRQQLVDYCWAPIDKSHSYSIEDLLVAFLNTEFHHDPENGRFYHAEVIDHIWKAFMARVGYSNFTARSFDIKTFIGKINGLIKSLDYPDQHRLREWIWICRSGVFPAGIYGRGKLYNLRLRNDTLQRLYDKVEMASGFAPLQNNVSVRIMEDIPSRIQTLKSKQKGIDAEIKRIEAKRTPEVPRRDLANDVHHHSMMDDFANEEWNKQYEMDAVRSSQKNAEWAPAQKWKGSRAQLQQEDWILKYIGKERVEKRARQSRSPLHIDLSFSPERDDRLVHGAGKRKNNDSQPISSWTVSDPNETPSWENPPIIPGLPQTREQAHPIAAERRGARRSRQSRQPKPTLPALPIIPDGFPSCRSLGIDHNVIWALRKEKYGMWDWPEKEWKHIYELLFRQQQLELGQREYEEILRKDVEWKATCKAKTDAARKAAEAKRLQAELAAIPQPVVRKTTASVTHPEDQRESEHKKRRQMDEDRRQKNEMEARLRDTAAQLQIAQSASFTTQSQKTVAPKESTETEPTVNVSASTRVLKVQVESTDGSLSPFDPEGKDGPFVFELPPPKQQPPTRMEIEDEELTSDEIEEGEVIRDYSP